MEIINTLEYQLSEILKLLNKDLKNGVVTYNYYINEKNSRFLDVQRFKKYLAETQIENLIYLKSICQKCIDINEIWTYKMDGLPDNRTGDKLNFNAISVQDNKFIKFTSQLAKEDFLQNYEYNFLALDKIASICVNIYNDILSTYSEINIDIKPQYYLGHYKKTNRFNLQNVLKPISQNEFNDFKNNLEKYLFNYKYIFDNLNNSERTKFKNNTIEHLKKVSNVQLNTEHKTALNDSINSIQANFNTKIDIDNIQVMDFFKIYNEVKIGDNFDDMLTKEQVDNLDKDKIIKIYNNDSFITPLNWDIKKDIFFQQRMEKYKDSYTIKEKIKLELEDLNKLQITKPDFKILADRYSTDLVSKVTVKAETKKPDEVLFKNQYSKIFKNDFGFTLFTKMYDLYKDENKDLANFSYLFYAMENDFLACSQVDFIKFLATEDYDIIIDKIDSRQSGTNKKSKLYNSIKDTLQKEHEKSTI